MRAFRAPLRHRIVRGFSLVEVLVSITIFVIALTGVTQLQIVASSANALTRKRMQAAQIASQVGASVQYWPFDSARLAASSAVSGKTAVAMPVIIDDRTDRLSTTMDFALGDYDGATNKNQRTVGGVTDPSLPDVSVDSTYRVYWSVSGEDRDSDGILDCKLISIVVRWQEGGLWHNLNLTQARFNLAILRPSYN